METSEARDASKGGRPRSIQAQQAILDATLALLASEGFDAMRRAADNAGEIRWMGASIPLKWNYTVLLLV